MATILVTEDERTILEALVVFLGMEGHTVLAAPDGVAAREMLENRVPDLVLTDVMMPRLDGIGLIDWMRSQTRLRHVPIVVMSATRISTVDHLPAVSFVPKPFDLDALLHAITRAIEPDGSTP
jgi:DNA-binding response OmpR family regulator